MRVLMLGWEFPPHVSGGLGTACFGITRGLANAGVDVLFVLPHARGDEDQRFAEVVGASGVNASSSATGFVQRTIDSPLRPYMTAASYGAARVDPNYGGDLAAEVARYSSAVGDVVAGRQFDCVHAHEWMTFSAGAKAARAAGCPLICHVHATEFDRNPDCPDPRICLAEREGLKAADLIVCVSHFTANRLMQSYGISKDRLRVVHNGVAGARSIRRAQRPLSASPTVLFLGRMTAQKAPMTFLEAAAAVAKAIPKARFVLAGDGELREGLIERASSLGLGERVSFPGFLVGSAVARAYREADVFVLPSAAEPFGIAPLEALCQGVPVIVPRTSGVAEVLHGSMVFEPGNTADLAEKVCALLRFPALREQCLAASYRDLAHLSWDERARSLVRVYRELVA